MEVIAELEQLGILLKTDPKLPNVCAIVAGEPIRGSWWAHPRSHEIFRVLTDLARHRDVLAVKLVSRKDTLLHRAFWPAILAIGMAREDWQMQTLDQDSRELLGAVEKRGSIEASGKTALNLEHALLVHGEQVHTKAGSHAKILTSWRQWAKRTGTKRGELQEAKTALEKLLDHLNARYGGRGRLPWPR